MTSGGTSPGGRRLVAASMVPPFDIVRVTVRPGQDAVVRVPGALMIVASGADDAQRQAAADILELLDSSGGARSPGYRLTRAMRERFSAGITPPALALVAATDDGLAVVLIGSASIGLPERGMDLTCNAGEIITREIDWPASALVLALSTDAGSAEADTTGSGLGFDLRSGVVPGGSAVLHPPPPQSTSPTGTLRVSDVPLAPPPPEQADAETLLSAPRRFERISGADPGLVRARPPLPVGIPAEPERDGAALVHGYKCRNGHLNDPRVIFCAVCGIRMAESTGVYIAGERPPLGLLIFDNGASFTVDHDYLLGREPDVDDRVRLGELRPLVIFDTTGVISRRHAEIRLHDWDVVLVDCGSSNGTLVAARGATEWSALVPGQAVRMLPGMQVRIGERTFTFESPHGAP